jgi:hypothetical protein
LVTLRKIAAKWLAADAKHIAQALNEGVLQEVTYDEKTEAEPPDEGVARKRR